MSIVLRNLALALMELGVEVDIYAPEHGPCDPEFFLDDPGFYDEAELLWRSVFRKPPRLIHLDAEDFSRSLLRLSPVSATAAALPTTSCTATTGDPRRRDCALRGNSACPTSSRITRSPR